MRGGHNKKLETWWINNRGYIEGRVWIDGRQIRIKQHRYVMEQHLGRKLNQNEDVHHINGNKTDNNIDNLVVIKHDEHTTASNLNRQYKSGYKMQLTDAARQARSDRAKLQNLSAIGRAAIAGTDGDHV